MKAYILSEEDMDLLLTMIDRDPAHGTQGGSSAALSQKERDTYDEVHRFYNYQVRNWMTKVKK